MDLVQLKNGSTEIIGSHRDLVDIVETGSTMKQNGLEPAQVIMQSSAFLISNKLSFVSKRDEILDIYHKLQNRQK